VAIDYEGARELADFVKFIKEKAPAAVAVGVSSSGEVNDLEL
jgi:hypothetical protein